MTLSCRLVALAPLLIVSTTLLSGCTTPYQVPYTANSATMIVHNASPKKMSMRVYGDAAECTKAQVVKPMLVGGEQRTIYLPTHGEVAMSIGQDLGLIASAGTSEGGCRNVFSFFPKPGQTYLLEVGTTTWCSVALVEKDGLNRRNPIEAEITPRKHKKPLTEEGPFCTKR